MYTFPRATGYPRERRWGPLSSTRKNIARTKVFSTEFTESTEEESQRGHASASFEKIP
jgi:hypothetical protein